MRDEGVVEIKREKSNLSRRAGGDEFGRAVSRIAVAQICESVGFESFNESALDALADIAVRYLRDLGRSASFNTNLAGRTETNVFDIIRGLEDLSASTGFLGASGDSVCLAESGTVRGIIEYVETAEEVPFVQPVPNFPIVKKPSRIPSFVQMGETPAFKHVPAWLPAFPDPHTYIHTPMWNERKTDPRADKIELARQRRKAESSLLNLQQRIMCNGSAVASTSTKLDNGFVAGESKNPYLAAPFKAGEKDVSTIVMPSKLSEEGRENKHVSLLETFAPAIEAIKEGISEFGDGAGTSIPDKRLAVRLNFKTARKAFLCESPDLSLLKKGGQASFWFGRDEDRDDKKRRAELIIRQSMENPMDLTQL
ncbi:hypothetical protein DCAR_0625521 [Daucus carota subsp. sativus]|uniref:Transcription initiation factor TFIID subunit 8 n=1 Tax=Daucus carota subsp. sativus TaxID=79200 RepID=A0A164WI55_DAUCS|nr:PREDICTED: transcription initiation factor TFIID subunit 8 [Daucus carota subsp. sativus]WOH06098.1 hypothetical protein DCAR_0625521 [Daucus carota subsp. sativus]